MQDDNEMKKEIILKKHYFGDRTVISIKYFVCIYNRKYLIGLSYQVLALFLELIFNLKNLKVLAEAAPVALKNQIRFKSSILGPNESFSKEETEYLIEQTLLTQLDDEPILVSGEH